jgi:hypothetical protein
VLNFISKSALKQATAWVKRESELDPSATIPAFYAIEGSKSSPDNSDKVPEVVGRFQGFKRFHKQ